MHLGPKNFSTNKNFKTYRISKMKIWSDSTVGTDHDDVMFYKPWIYILIVIGYNLKRQMCAGPKCIFVPSGAYL